MATILSKPDELSLSGNLKPFKVSTSESLNFILSVGTEILVNETYHPSDSIVEIDVKDVVINALSFVLQYNTSYVQPSIIRTFVASIDGEDYPFRAIRTGISNLADTPSNWLKGNFLTWQPKLKKVTYYTPEWITYFAVIACDIKVKAYFPGNTNETVTLQSCSAGNAYTINMQYAVVSELFSGKKPMYYEVAAYSGSSQLSYIQKYVVSDQISEDEQWILFENTLGGIDTFRAFGITDFSGQHTYNSSVIDNVMEEYLINTERLYTKNTGHLNKYERRWLLDFFPSRAKYIYQESAIHKIALKESDVAYKSSDLPSNYTFTYCFADISPYLNLIRNEDELPDNISIPVPDAPNFTIPPRLAEFPKVLLHEGVAIPAFDPNSDAPTTTTFGAIKQAIVDTLPGSDGIPGSGGTLVTLIKSEDSTTPTDNNAFSSLKTLKELQKYIIKHLEQTDERYIRKDIEDKVKKLITFEKGICTSEIKSETYTPGRLGSGMAFYTLEGKTYAEVDFLFVRREALFNRLTIADIKSVGGQILVSIANMHCSKVDEHETYYRCYFDTENGSIVNQFDVDDLVICQTFNSVKQKYYWRLVTYVGDDYIDLSKSDCDGTGIPTPGDDIIQFGNKTNESRQSAILISAYGPDAPSIKQYMFVNSYDLTGKDATSISPVGNKFTGDFILKTGINVATQLKILEGLIKSEIQSIEHYINDEDNYLNNASFSANMDGWEKGPSTLVVGSTDGVLGFNGEFLGDGEYACDIVPHEGKYMLRVKNSHIKQLNSNLKNYPLAPVRFYVSFRYLCDTAGTIECGFEGSSFYRTENIATIRVPKTFQFSGVWDGTGDFIIKFSGDIYMSLVTVTNRPLDDFKIQVQSSFEQTAKSIQALVKTTDNLNKTISEAGWLTTSDGVDIWASCKFDNGTSVISLFNISSEGIKLKGTNIDLTGVVSFESFSTDLKTTLSKSFDAASLAAKDAVAQNLGYTDFAAFVENALTQGKTLIINGYVNTELIDVDTLLAGTVIADAIKANGLNINDKLIIRPDGSVRTEGAIIAGNGSKIGGMTIEGSCQKGISSSFFTASEFLLSSDIISQITKTQTFILGETYTGTLTGPSYGVTLPSQYILSLNGISGYSFKLTFVVAHNTSRTFVLSSFTGTAKIVNNDGAVYKFGDVSGGSANGYIKMGVGDVVELLYHNDVYYLLNHRI